jgi:hypothetical protein
VDECTDEGVTNGIPNINDNMSFISAGFISSTGSRLE